jgi:PAS domain S-box-containing protein
MSLLPWQRTSLTERVRWLRYVLPPALVLVVIIYQLGIAQSIQRDYGHSIHYSVEIGFYSLVGPVVTLLTLTWVERRLIEQEKLERQVHARTQQLASLTAVSADAILSLDTQGQITSWNQGAERMFGYEGQDIEGQLLNHLLPDAQLLDAQLDKQGVVKDFETTAIASDGRALTVDLTQTRLTETVEGSTASLIIMRDVTTRRERENIREEERARIARDLHDGVAQTIYFMALKADMIRQQVTQKPEWAAAELKEIGNTARQAIREVRRTIFALRPLKWSNDDFVQALATFVEEFAEQSGWQVDVNIDESMPTIPSRLEPTIFRLVQESLNNVAKHAEADRVWISLQRAENVAILELLVRDDGCGFDQDEVTDNGLGLNQMRERVNAVGGTLQIESRSGTGTSVTAQIPLLGPANGDAL